METFFKLSPQDYIQATQNADMSVQYEFLQPYLKPGASILDVGFGSARDMRYFKKLGYKVKGIDIQQEFVTYAKALDLDVELADITTYKPKEKYDAIWCCASLVHASLEELPEIFEHLKTLLKPDGVVYCSFKYGEWEGYIAETYCTYLTEEKIKKFNLNIIDMKIAKDNLSRNNNWISFIFKK